MVVVVTLSALLLTLGLAHAADSPHCPKDRHAVTTDWVTNVVTATVSSLHLTQKHDYLTSLTGYYMPSRIYHDYCGKD